jgi:hypothetical protein
MGPNISISEFALLLRGWSETKRRLRVVLETPAVTFGVFGMVHSADDRGSFSVAVTGSSMIAVSFAGCVCGFRDTPAEDEVLGERVESGLVAVRSDFSLVVILLAE